MTNQDEKFSHQWDVTSSETVFRGFYRIDKVEFTHELFNGGTSDVVDREQFVRGNVVGVLVHDPDLDKVVMVEQFRIGARFKQAHPWLVEIIAGMVEPGEQPEEVAVREAYEEAGLRLTNVQQFTHYLASPGASTEEVFLYYAQADLRDAGGVFGLAEEGEDIRVHVLDADVAVEWLDSGKICNALSIIAMQWFKIRRLKNAA